MWDRIKTIGFSRVIWCLNHPKQHLKCWIFQQLLRWNRGKEEWMGSASENGNCLAFNAASLKESKKKGQITPSSSTHPPKSLSKIWVYITPSQKNEKQLLHFVESRVLTTKPAPLFLQQATGVPTTDGSETCDFHHICEILRIHGLQIMVTFFRRVKWWEKYVHTLQGINISHLGKRKIIFKMPFFGDMLVSWRVHTHNSRSMSGNYMAAYILSVFMVHVYR